jgi:DNA-binding transcriptional regulator YiaG
MMTKCVQCGSEERVPADVPVSRALAGATFTATVAGEQCARCGATYAGQAALERVDQFVARDLAAAGVASGDALRFMRKVVGIPAREFAELLGVAPETVSRWENGQRAVDPTALRSAGSTSPRRTSATSDDPLTPGSSAAR